MGNLYNKFEIITKLLKIYKLKLFNYGNLRCKVKKQLL